MELNEETKENIEFDVQSEHINNFAEDGNDISIDEGKGING